MAKLDTLDVAPHMEPFSLPELAQDILQQFEPNAEQLNIMLNMQGDTHIPFVQADIALIQRVFENLIGNALRHVKQGGSISVLLQEGENSVSVSIVDTGCGIANDALDKIFDPLYQVNNIHRSGEHAGLGLAIVKRIIELHQSSIEVSSVEGEGTCFTFKLAIL